MAPGANASPARLINRIFSINRSVGYVPRTYRADSDVTGGYINPEAQTMKEAAFKIADYIQAHTAQYHDNVITLKTALL